MIYIPFFFLHTTFFHANDSNRKHGNSCGLGRPLKTKKLKENWRIVKTNLTNDKLVYNYFREGDTVLISLPKDLHITLMFRLMLKFCICTQIIYFFLYRFIRQNVVGCHRKLHNCANSLLKATATIFTVSVVVTFAAVKYGISF